MKKLVLFFTLGFCVSAHAAQGKMPQSFGIDWDKMLHFSAGYIAADGVGRLEEDAMGIQDKWQIGPILGAVTIGVLKEWADSQEGGSGWSNEDLAATILGGGFRVVIHVNWFQGARKVTGYDKK